MLVFCWNPAVSVLLVLVRRPLVPRPPYFLCRVGGITKSLLQRLLKWLFLLRSGSFLFRSTLIANLSWNVHASFQVMLKRNDGVLTHDTRHCGTHPGCHCVHWHTLVPGRGGPTTGTSNTCIEKKNLANVSHVLPHSGRKLSTDISLVSTMKIWRGFQENTCV